VNVAGSTMIFEPLLLARTAREVSVLGFRYVDIAAFPGGELDPSGMVGAAGATVQRINEACAAADGLSPVAFNSALRGTEDERGEQMRALASVASGVGAKVITLQAAGAEEALEEDLERMRRLVSIACEYGVTLTVETHIYTHTEDPEVALRYASEVQGLGLTLDPTHFAVRPHHWQQGFKDLMPHVRHMHLRPSGRSWDEVQLAVGEGIIDFGELIEDLRMAGYGGALSVEYVRGIPGVDHEAEARRLRDLVEALLPGEGSAGAATLDIRH